MDLVNLVDFFSLCTELTLKCGFMCLEMNNFPLKNVKF